MTQHTLVVGASQAGLGIAATLRGLGDDGAITLVGHETHAPYQRPPLSKAFLAGKADGDALALRATNFYERAGIELICGRRVTEITLDPDERGGIATLDDDRVLTFDRLALTVGARPRRLNVPGHDLDGICYLRSLDDAAYLRERMMTAKNIAVIGGGFVGLETSAVATTLGKSVTVIEAADRLLSRAVAPVVSEFYREAHTRRGATVLVSSGVVGFDGDQHVTGVRLDDGSVLPADLVIVGVGVTPRTELAKRLGLEVADGIVVDRYARTSNTHVVAAGDCTVLPHPMTQDGLVRLESVDNAVTQSRAAAYALLGELKEGTTVPWFWSDQADLKLQIAGSTTGYDEHVVRGDPDSEQFSVLYYRDRRLFGIDAVNRPADYMAVRTALSDRATIPAHLAGNVDVTLKSLITTAEHADRLVDDRV